MSCPSSIEGTERMTSKLFSNWALRFNFRSREAYKPETRGEVVELIRRAELDPANKIKWTGSRWSFMRTFESQDVVIESDNIYGLVEIDRANADLSQRKILNHLTLTPTARILNRDGNLVHIKGGTKIFNANRLLHGLPLTTNDVNHEIPIDERALSHDAASKAFSTLGGSGGQSIAGAISTGTHGGDFNHPPVADHVEAIHLIGPGGQEWWIERTDGITAGSEADTEAALRGIASSIPDADDEICNDIRVRKDDNFFHAVMVSLGRMGFIYSLVMRVEPAFKLTEVRSESFWQDFRSTIQGRRLLELTDETGRDLHYLNIVIMPFADGDGRHVCKVAQRVKHTTEEDSTPAANEGFDITNVLCRISDARVLIPILLGVIGILGGIAAGIAASIPGLAAIPFVGWALAIAAGVALAAVAAAIVTVTGLTTFLIFGGRTTVRELVGAISDVGFRLGLGDLTITFLTALFNATYPVEEDVGGTSVPYQRTNYSWKIMDTYPYGPENFCEKVDSMDFAFEHSVIGEDAPAYFAFIDDVLALFEDLRSRRIAVAGNMALRFSQPTSSFLGMSKYVRTCHIEIAALRGFPGSTEFVERVQGLAKDHSAVPSWGQLFDQYDAADVRGLHRNIDLWRQVLTSLIRDGGGNDFTFSNNFTVQYNLEPLGPSLIRIKQLRIEIEIGRDGVRGQDAAGTSHLLGDLHYDLDGRTATDVIQFNNIGTAESPNWRGWGPGIHSKIYTFPEPILILEINRLVMYMPAAGGLAGDNADVNQVTVRAVSIDDSECIIGTINVPFRFTGANERVAISFSGCL